MSHAAQTRKPATYEDLLRVPDHFLAEILNGELFTTPRPTPRHAHTAARLSAALGTPFDEGRGGPGGWIILFEPEVHLHADIVVPDLAGWRREGLSTLPDGPYLTLAPDWACEILSPSTERVDRLHKPQIYSREGVRHVWLINPMLRTLEILRLEGSRWVVAATHGDEDDAVPAEPFDAVPLALSRIWPD